MKLILDPSCGPKTWLRGNMLRYVTCDILASVKPDVVADMKALPFADGAFDAIRFDPPHLIRNDVKHWHPDFPRYGQWKNRRELEITLLKANKEFYRVTKPGATLLVKLVDGRDKRVTKGADLWWFTGWKQAKQYVTPSRVEWSSNNVLWTWFRRADETSS